MTANSVGFLPNQEGIVHQQLYRLRCHKHVTITKLAVSITPLFRYQEKDEAFPGTVND